MKKNKKLTETLSDLNKILSEYRNHKIDETVFMLNNLARVLDTLIDIREQIGDNHKLMKKVDGYIQDVQKKIDKIKKKGN